MPDRWQRNGYAIRARRAWHRKRIHSSQEHLAVSDNALEQRANAP